MAFKDQNYIIGDCIVFFWERITKKKGKKSEKNKIKNKTKVINTTNKGKNKRYVVNLFVIVSPVWWCYFYKYILLLLPLLLLLLLVVPPLLADEIILVLLSFSAVRKFWTFSKWIKKKLFNNFIVSPVFFFFFSFCIYFYLFVGISQHCHFLILSCLETSSFLALFLFFPLFRLPSSLLFFHCKIYLIIMWKLFYFWKDADLLD